MNHSPRILPPDSYRDEQERQLRRERIAVPAMVGLLRDVTFPEGWTAEEIARKAVQMADALIKELDD